MATKKVQPAVKKKRSKKAKNNNKRIVLFVIEMIVKIKTFSFKGYWESNWNRLDFILVCISTPAILTTFFEVGILSNLSVLLTLRLLRVFRLFRAFHFFPNFGKIMEGLSRALSQSKAILLGFFVIIVISGLINCCLFKNVAPEYFATPLDSIYTVFRIFVFSHFCGLRQRNVCHSLSGLRCVFLLHFYFITHRPTCQRANEKTKNILGMKSANAGNNNGGLYNKCYESE